MALHPRLPEVPYKAIVSVLMLKEGWDVRNVTTIVGLRAFTAASNTVYWLARFFVRERTSPASSTRRSGVAAFAKNHLAVGFALDDVKTNGELSN